jgi:hypothetical protein
LYDLTSKNVLWQQRQLRVKDQGGPHGTRAKAHVVPTAERS